jgi:CMP-N,N'-diacetyllegionaminic acid synthase
LLENKGFYGPKTYAYVMPKDRSVDIDTEFDFNLAEFFAERHRV